MCLHVISGLVFTVHSWDRECDKKAADLIMCTYNTIQLNTPTTPHQPGFVSLQFFVAISSRIVVIIREIIMNQPPSTRHSSVDISAANRLIGDTGDSAGKI